MGIEFIILLAGTFLGGFASGLSGFAYALVASAVFLHVLPPMQSTALVLLGSIVAQLFSIWRIRNAIVWPRAAPFMIGGVIGIPFGNWALHHLPIGAFRLAVGAVLLTYSLYMLVFASRAPRIDAPRVADGAVGIVGGTLAAMAGLSGSLVTIWCSWRGWSPAEQRGVFQPFVILAQSLGFVALIASGGFDLATLRLFLLNLPALLLGVWLGMRLFDRIDAEAFRRVVLVLLLAAGVALLMW
jgi:uncharacterized membrane protein YfcA